MSTDALAQGAKATRTEKMPFALTGGPAEASAQLIAHLTRKGVLDASGNVAQSTEDASYEEAQSRLRMSTLCKECVRKLDYPLPARIVELAISAQSARSSNAEAQGRQELRAEAKGRRRA